MSGFLFGTGPAGWWDSGKCSCPVVHRLEDGYRMWYYGHEPEFPGLIQPAMSSIPMGRSGTAVSSDGIHWDRVRGPGVLGSVLDPSHDPDRFDQFQVGATDVIRVGAEFWLYFMGAKDGIRDLMGRTRKGDPVAIGLARSTDGVRFEKLDGDAGGGAVFAPDRDNGEWSVGFPRVLALAGGGYRMYYSTGGANNEPAIDAADSADGLHWERRGRVFGANPDPAAFDARGAGTRHVIPYQGGYLMAYEALPAGPGFNFRIGLATSADGLHWDRLRGRGTNGATLDLGGPGTWDALAIGTPYLVPDPDGSIGMYYVGFSEKIETGIGLAVTDGQDLSRWEKYA